MRRPQLSDLTDRLPDAISTRLPGSTPTRRITGKRVAIGGGVFAVLAALGALGSAAARKRYVTGEAKIDQVVDIEKGSVVFLDNGTAFWVSADTRRVLDGYTGDGAQALPYKIDLANRHLRSGLAVGTVNTGR